MSLERYMFLFSQGQSLKTSTINPATARRFLHGILLPVERRTGYKSLEPRAVNTSGIKKSARGPKIINLLHELSPTVEENPARTRQKPSSWTAARKTTENR